MTTLQARPLFLILLIRRVSSREHLRKSLTYGEDAARHAVFLKSYFAIVHLVRYVLAYTQGVDTSLPVPKISREVWITVVN